MAFAWLNFGAWIQPIENVMPNSNKLLADALEALSDQAESDRMNALVNQSAWLALVRQLSARGLVNLQTLEQDLLTLGSTDLHEGWRAGHEGYAGAVRLLHGFPSAGQ